MVIWISAAFAGAESIRKLLEHGHTTDVGAGIAGAAIGILGNQAVCQRRHVIVFVVLWRALQTGQDGFETGIVGAIHRDAAE